MEMTNKKNGFVLWLMGPTSSGKTTIAAHLTQTLLRRGLPVLHYDGDEVRDSSELVTFTWDGTAGTALERDSVTLAFNVEDFQISYRDLNNSVLSPSPDLSIEDRDSIRRLDIQLKLSEEDEEFTLLTSIIPRNLRQVRGTW